MCRNCSPARICGAGGLFISARPFLFWCLGYGARATMRRPLYIFNFNVLCTFVTVKPGGLNCYVLSDKEDEIG